MLLDEELLEWEVMNTGIDDVNEMENGKWNAIERLIILYSKSVKKSFYSRVRVTNSANLVSIMIV